MNEQITLRLLQCGTPLPVERLTSDGITIGQETCAWPRAISLSLVPRDDYTRARIRRVQDLHGWYSWQFKLECNLEDGAIVVRGADPDSLPWGNYELRLSIYDMVVPHTEFITLSQGEAERADVDVLPDPRRFELATPFDAFDPRIQQACQGASLDGTPIAQWLASACPARPSRKACLLNILAKLRVTPSVADPLIQYVRRIFFADVDRIYTEVAPDFYTIVRNFAADPAHHFYREGRPVAGIHTRLLAASGFTSDLDSYRQEGDHCLQSVFTVDQNASHNHYADLDIDLGNPLQDVHGFVVHVFAEVLPGRHTDHLGMRRYFARGSTADYMYYKVV